MALRYRKVNANQLYQVRIRKQDYIEVIRNQGMWSSRGKPYSVKNHESALFIFIWDDMPDNNHTSTGMTFKFWNLSLFIIRK